MINPYDDLIEQGNPYAPETDDQTRARASLAGVRSVNPDARARARKLAEELGIPSATVERNEAQATAISEQNKYDTLLNDSPELAKWLADPENAAIAKDDVESLSAVERAMRALNGGVRAVSPLAAIRPSRDVLTGVFQAGSSARALGAFSELGRERSIEQLSTVFGEDTARFLVNRNPLLAKSLIPGGPAEASAANVLSVAGEASVRLADYTRPEDQNFADQSLEAVGQIGALIAVSLLTGGQGSLAVMFGQGADIQNERAKAAGATDDERFKAMALGGVITAASEKVALDRLLKRIPPKIKNQVLQKLTDLAIAGGIEGVQEVVEGIGQNLVALGLYDPEAKVFVVEEAAEEGGVAATAGAFVRALITTAMPGRAGRGEAFENAERLEKVVEAAGNSKLMTRAKEQLEQFIAQASEGAKVYFDVADLRTLYQADGFIDRLGIDPDEMAEAEVTGGYVGVDVGRYVGEAGSEVGEGLRRIVRTDPEALSIEETANVAAREALQREFEEAIALEEVSEETRDIGRRIREDVTLKLTTAGQPIEVARSQAAVWGALFETLESKGIEARSTFEQLGLQIQGPQSTEARRVDDLDLLIEDLKAGNFPDVTEAYGTPLLEFVRTLGIKDDRGDLASQDINLVRRPGQRNIPRDDGKSLDDVGLAAFEAGYFDERPDLNTLIDALIEEGRGNILYPEGAGDPVIQERLAQLEALDEYVAQNDIDLSGDTASVRKQLQGALQEDGDGRTLEQSERASVTFPVDGIFSDKAVFVRLSETADFSSFLHESAHIFLELYAELEKVSPEIEGEMQAIRDWLGNEGGAFTTEQHEKFAEGFEAYLFEGKAPTVELQPVFVKFKAWLTRIYKSLKNMRIQLNPVARDIFDRMLATEDAIEAAQAARGLRSVSALADLIAPEVAEKYRSLADEARARGEETLLKKALKEIKRQEGKEYREAKAKLLKEIEADVRSRPVYRAFEYLMDADNQRLDKQAIIDLRGKSVLNRLLKGKRRVYQDDGVHPDKMAVKLGFESGDDLVMQLANAAPIKEQVSREADAELKRRYGDFLNDGSLEREAAAAVMNDPQGKLFMIEQNALAAKALTRAMPMRQIKAIAKNIIDNSPVKRAVRPGYYAKRSQDFSRKTVALAQKGKFTEALRAKQQQILNHELSRLAYAAKEERGRIEKYLAKFSPRKKPIKAIHPDFFSVIRDLILLPQGGVDTTNLRAFPDRAVNEFGLAVMLPSEFILNGEMKPLEDTSMNDLRDYRDSIRSVEFAGRRVSEDAQEEFKRDMRELAEGITEKAGSKHAVGPFQRENKSVWNKMVEGGEFFSSGLRKLPFLLRVLDGSPDGVGAMYRRVMIPLRHAGGRELQLKRENETEINRIFDEYGLGKDLDRSRKRFSRVLNRSIDFTEVFSIALNLGNKGNAARLATDPRFNSEATARAVVDEFFEKRHWEAAQAIWDFIDSRWPEIAALEQRTTGVVPAKVDAVPVETKFGRFSGGYYPLKYDPIAIDNKEITDAATEFDFKALVSGGLARAQTRHGHTIERADKVSREVWLSMSVLTRHLDEVAHDLAYREAVSDAWRVLNNRSVRKSINEAIGSENYKAMLDIVKRIAGGQIKPNGFVERMMRTLRVNAASADLGLNVRSILTQPLGLTQSFAKLGRKTMTRGIAEYLQDVPGSAKMVFEKSEFMRNRSRIITRDMRDAVSGERSRGVLNKIRAGAMFPMQILDVMGVATPTWLAAYREHLETTGDEMEAIAYADGIVADTQGSGLIMDLTTLQSGTELSKLFTYMYGYFSTTLNLTYEAGAIAKKHPARAVGMMIMLYTIPGVLAEFVLSGLSGDDEDDLESRFLETFLMAHLNQSTAALPGAREMVSVFRYRSGQETFFGRALRGVGDVVSDIEDVYQDGEFDAEQAHSLVENVIRTGGLLFGIPGAGQMARLYDTVTQDDDPTLYEAILTGKDDDN